MLPEYLCIHLPINVYIFLILAKVQLDLRLNSKHRNMF